MAHARRDFNNDRCPAGHTYAIAQRVEETLRAQSPEVQQAISDTGVLGSVRDINGVLLARCRVANQA
eukprot:16141754-Heterocapsa_arctica.AAC.1